MGRFRSSGSRVWAAACAAGSLVLSGAVSAAAPALHEQIDRAIAARAGGPLAGRSSDAEFLRRVSLDLSGAIPTAEQARAFLADGDPAKRAKLIDRLLAGPDYPRRMEQALTVALLERRRGETVPDAEWSRYLREAFAANRPWDRIVREILGADGTDPAVRPAMKFFTDGRPADAHRMAQDVGRLFLGVSLQCAQCHDHPTVAEWTQADYYGLYAFFQQSRLHVDPKTKKTFFVEGAAAGKAEFESVFSPGKRSTGPRLPGGREVDVPVFAKGEEFAAPAQEGLPAVPRFRPRVLLAEQLPSPGSARFARAAVNRFWFMMMGRGLVHPLDMDHAANPPSHPELLDLLAREFAGSGFDVRRLLRELALSETYQRSSLLPAGVSADAVPPQSYRVANPKPLSAEQLAWAVPQAAGELERLLAAPAPEKPSFVYKDYASGRVPDPPSNITDAVELFAAVFGSPPGEPEVEFQASLSHSLFLMNERLLLRWLAPRAGNLVDRLAGMRDDAATAEALYLSALTRLPDAEESRETVDYLARNRQRRAAAVGELAWALIASAEFRLNH